jgi:hypothetical protein
VQLLFDLLSSCSGSNSTPRHDDAAGTLPTLTFNVLQSYTPRVGLQRSRCGTGGFRRDGSYCRGVRHRCRPKPRSPLLAVLLRLAVAGPSTAQRHVAVPRWYMRSCQSVSPCGLSVFRSTRRGIWPSRSRPQLGYRPVHSLPDVLGEVATRGYEYIRCSIIPASACARL